MLGVGFRGFGVLALGFWVWGFGLLPVLFAVGLGSASGLGEQRC